MMKKVLFVTHENLELTPVSKAMFLDVANYLEQEQHYFVRVFSASKNQETTAKHFKFKRQTQGAFDLQSVISLLSSYGLFFRALKGMDIVVFRSYPSMILFSRVSKILGKKVVFDTRGLFFDELVDSGKISYRWLKVLSFLEKRLLIVADKTLCVTKYQKDFYIDKYQIPDDKFDVIPNGARNFKESIDKTSVTKGELTLCYVGSLVKWHAPELVRDFCYELQRLGLRFKLDVITRDLNKASEIFSGLDNVDIYSHNYRNDPIKFDYGICFIKGGISKSVCYPVKFNEYIMSGTKVLALDNVLEVKGLIEKYNFGLVLKGDKACKLARDFFKSLDEQRLSGLTCDDNLKKVPIELTFDYQVRKYVNVISELSKDI